MHPRLVPLMSAALLVTAAACSSSTEGSARIRVDQLGFVTDGVKHAYLMAADAPESFRVVAESGTVVLESAPSSTAARWSDAYPAVRVLDLTAVTTPGQYRVEAAGAVSPPFRIDAAQALFAGPVADTARFFVTQHDTAHTADRAADVYAAPRYDPDGKTLLDPALTKVGGPVDVSGGWFDAGDFLKFTHTTSYATAQLLLAQRDSPVHSDAVAAEARYGLDWLGRVWDGSTLYAQVGIGAGNEGVLTDHDVWRRPQDDDALDVAPGDPKYHVKHRPVFRANEPGTPVSPNLAGRVAAAFALSAQVAPDPTSARRSLDTAATLFAKADTSGAPLVTAFPRTFYPETAWQDDLEFAAVELALAGRTLGDPRSADWQTAAARWATAYLDSDTRGTLGLADVSALAHADLARISDGPLKERLVTDLERQLDEGVSRAAKDPFGAGAVYTEFDSVPHTFGLVITAALHHSVTGDSRYDAFGTTQRGWALGANAWGSSFVIGIGTTFPRCPEHQGANLTGDTPTGAVVNGPNAATQFTELNAFEGMKPCTVNDFEPYDGHDARYVDHVGAWQSVEPAIDFTSTGLLAFALSAR
ncbi:glycoside hydrolase family 9 protein [Umezawaea sp. NPDC059074]|uniref:glycoside hydrolase family 9 protein n=1 Tax=Umezawaea sp. NPDC059074 TaxID=3346716 RepID=UPI0036B30367